MQAMCMELDKWPLLSKMISQNGRRFDAEQYAKFFTVVSKFTLLDFYKEDKARKRFVLQTPDSLDKTDPKITSKQAEASNSLIRTQEESQVLY